MSCQTCIILNKAYYHLNGADLNVLPAELVKSPVLAKISDCSQVSCGIDFTAWLCKGQLFTAGNPQYGQLGHGTDHEYNAKDCEALPSGWLRATDRTVAHYVSNGS